jgi:hypothetical protein
MIGDYPLEGMLLDRGPAALRGVLEGDGLLARPVEDDLLDALVEHFPGLLQIEAVVLAERLQHGEIKVIATVPAADGAARERQVRMRDDALGVEEIDRAQAVAARARAHRVVEREQARLELGQRIVAKRAGELRREEMLPARVGFHDHGAAVGMAQRSLERVGEPLLDVGARAQPVDHYVDSVLHLLRKLRRRVELVHFSVDAHPREPLRAQLVQELGLLAFSAGHHRSENHEAGVLRQLQYLIHHLRHGLRLQRDPVLRAVRRADPRIEQAQVIVDLGDRAHGRARVVARRLLLDGDRRREAFDEIHVRLFHELQELARVRRQRLHVAPLALGVQRVEGERALARARKAGDHHQPVARQLDADVLEIVGARSANADAVHRLQKKKVNLVL